MMDKITNRQFRHCPYGLLSAVAASLELHESDVMFRMTEKRGRANSIGFRRFHLDPSFHPRGAQVAEPEAESEETHSPQVLRVGRKTHSKKRSGMEFSSGASSMASERRTVVQISQESRLRRGDFSSSPP